jgi:hypothetical protein
MFGRSRAAREVGPYQCDCGVEIRYEHKQVSLEFVSSFAGLAAVVSLSFSFHAS